MKKLYKNIDIIEDNQKIKQYTIYEVDTLENDLIPLTYFLNVEEVAEYLGIKKTLIYEVIKGTKELIKDNKKIAIFKDII